MRKLICTILAIICVASLAVFVSGCGPTLEEFTANENRRYVEVGETFSVPRPTAKDSKGNMLIPEVTFSKTEYEEAQWFRFMPKYDRIPSCESELVYSYFCQKPNGTIDYDSHHLRQIGTYRLRHRPRWPSPPMHLIV